MAASRILVIEDEEVARLLYKRLLERLGHRHDMAETLAEARAFMAKAERYDLLVTDIRLPDGRGTDILEEFSRRFPGARMLVVTGSPEMTPSEAPKVFLPGVEKMFKPFEVDEFVEAVQRLLQK